MSKRIFSDAEARPDLFLWNESIDRSSLKEWLAENRWQIPDDLFLFWRETGGGDIYETETIFGPVGDADLGEDVLEINEELRKGGMPEDFLVFHQGTGGLSAVRLSDGQYLQLSEDDFSESGTYSSLEEWYDRVIRDEYADRYGLAPLFNGNEEDFEITIAEAQTV